MNRFANGYNSIGMIMHTGEEEKNMMGICRLGKIEMHICRWPIAMLTVWLFSLFAL